MFWFICSLILCGMNLGCSISATVYHHYYIALINILASLFCGYAAYMIYCSDMTLKPELPKFKQELHKFNNRKEQQ